REPPVLMLAEEGDEPASKLAQLRRRAAPALDEGPGAALGPNSAGEHQLAGGLGDPLAQLGQLRLVEKARGHLEDALDVGLAGARPNDPRPRLAAQQQVQRVGEDGLAGARLARDGVEAGSRA